MLSQLHDIYQTNPAFKKRICLGILCFNTVNQWEIITQSSCRRKWKNKFRKSVRAVVINPTCVSIIISPLVQLPSSDRWSFSVSLGYPIKRSKSVTAVVSNTESNFHLSSLKLSSSNLHRPDRHNQMQKYFLWKVLNGNRGLNQLWRYDKFKLFSYTFQYFAPYEYQISITLVSFISMLFWNFQLLLKWVKPRKSRNT